MNQGRRTKLESLLFREIAILLRELSQKGKAPLLTLNRVELNADGGQLSCFVVPLGQTIGQSVNLPEDWLHALNQHAYSLKGRLLRSLRVKHIPHLVFCEDQGLINSFKVHDLLEQIAKENSDSSEGSSIKPE